MLKTGRDGLGSSDQTLGTVFLKGEHYHIEPKRFLLFYNITYLRIAVGSFLVLLWTRIICEAVRVAATPYFSSFPPTLNAA